MVSGKNRVPEGLPEPPGGTNGPPWALVEREEGSQGRPRTALGVRIGQGKGGGAPLSFLPPLPLLPSPSLPFGGNLLGLGVLVGFPSWGRAKEGRLASPLLLYICNISLLGA